MTLLTRNGRARMSPVDWTEPDTPSAAIRLPAGSLAATAKLAQSGADLIGVEAEGPFDGRVASLARALRSAGYPGRIRAIGAFLPDQVSSLFSVGIDEIEVIGQRASDAPGLSAHPADGPWPYARRLGWSPLEAEAATASDL